MSRWFLPGLEFDAFLDGSTIGADSVRAGGANSDLGANQEGDFLGAIDLGDIEAENDFDDYDMEADMQAEMMQNEMLEYDFDNENH